MDIFWIFLGYFLDISWIFFGYILDIFWIAYPEYIQTISTKYPFCHFVREKQFLIDLDIANACYPTIRTLHRIKCIHIKGERILQLGAGAKTGFAGFNLFHAREMHASALGEDSSRVILYTYDLHCKKHIVDDRSPSATFTKPGILENAEMGWFQWSWIGSSPQTMIRYVYMSNFLFSRQKIFNLSALYR